MEFIFWPPTTKTIISITFPMQYQEERFFRPFTNDGIYTSKFGYNIIRKTLAKSFSPLSYALVLPQKLWNSF